MRISVVLPDSLSTELELCRRQERRGISAIVRDALSSYLIEHRRRAGGEALMRAVEEAPMDTDQVRHALGELREERERSDRL